MRKLILIIVSAFALVGSPALAKDAGSAAWVVSQLSGDARVVHRGLQPVALKATTRLVPGDRVVTGVTGRATLTRGSDYIIISPRSDLQLPAAPQPTGFTRVIQNLGTMLFKVKHTGVPHFAVDTPMLAAVVKGTTFTVVVGKDRSAVQVIQGKVEVTAIDGGMSRLVEGGKTVFIDRNEPKRLIDADQRSPSATTTTTAVKVTGSQSPSVATLAGWTGGLVQPGSQASVPASTTPLPGVPNGDPAPTAAKADQATVIDVNATPSGATDAVTDPVDTGTETVTDGVDKTSDTTADAITDVVDTTTDVVDTTTGTVTDVVDTTTDVVDTTAGAVTDVVGTVTDVVDTTTGTVTDVV
ncbi:MAG TPA: FecR family protein, partial [Candidatus Limnocylindrales bacterium]